MSIDRNPSEPSLFPQPDRPAPLVRSTRVERSREYQIHCHSIASSIIDGMKNGGAWKRPWDNGIQLARNRVTGKYYSGRNLLVLWNQCVQKGYSTNEWATFNQWKTLGSLVKKREKGTLICIAFPKPAKGESNPTVFDIEGETSDEEPSSGGFWFKLVHLFNRDQVTGQDPDQTDAFKEQTTTDLRLSRFFNSLAPNIIHDPDRALYMMRDDKIRMPSLAQFKATDERTAKDHYQTTLLHEMIHWTGHPRRCGRSFWGPKNSRIYAFEELIAEFGSAFLAAHFKNRQVPVQHHSHYIRSWYHMLELNPSYLIDALNYAVYASLWMLKKVDPDDYNHVAIRLPSMPDERMNWLKSA